ncbi:MAG: hypothetical protein FWD91_07030, partial [Treponema sp.]|nr:hypothetical protein [Treponema sp.]
NFAVFIIAALVFLAAGLWAAIPVFGLLRRDEPPPGKPLRERFVAEGRFLKRYGALELYYGAYVKEIKRQFARKENITANEEIISRVSDLLGEAAGGGRESQLFASAVREEPIPYRDFPKMITIFQTILERI